MSENIETNEKSDGSFDPLIGHPKRKAILAVMCLSLIVIVLDSSILNVALPTISRSLNATDQELLWFIDSYTLIFAGLLLSAGTIGDKYGRRRLLQIGLVIFGIASVIAAFAQTSEQLIIGRGLMGIGGAAIMPSTLSIITNVFPPKERGRAIGIWAGFAGVGVAVGPIAGGFLIEHFWWGSIFFVNIPIAIFAVGANQILVPESKSLKSEKIDYVGAILSIIALTSLLYAIIFGTDEGFFQTHIIVAGTLALISLTSFFIWESRSSHPMLQLKFFKDKRFSAGTTSITLIFFAMFAMSFLITQYLQSVLGFTPLESGVRFIPFALAMIITAPSSAKVVSKIGTKFTVVTGLSIVLIALISMTTLRYDDSYINVVWMMILMSIGMGLTMAPSTSAIMNSLPRDKAGIGSAMNDTTRMFGGALGLAISGSVFASIYNDRLKKTPAIQDLRLVLDNEGIAKSQQTLLENNLTSSIGRAIGTADALKRPELIPDIALRNKIASFPQDIRDNVANTIITSAQKAFVQGMHLGLWVSVGAILIAIIVALRWLPKSSLADDQLAK